MFKIKFIKSKNTYDIEKSGGVTLDGNPLASFPVGSIYISVKDISPAQVFGGNWRLLDENYALWTTKTTEQGGVKISAGLPNITGNVGSIWACRTFDNSPSFSGATQLGGQVTNGSAAGNGWQMYLHNLNFNASQSNSIYGSSTTVQPPAIKVFAWERVEN